uniref:Uncharacterized protein n=1 Tax=Acrobeloides nanus TaxID=290746 RepID=A0A914C9E1_9BILA
MPLSNTSVLKQSDNAAGDVYESRRPSSSEKTRIAFIEVLRGVYMKKKGDTIPWSDIKKGYRKKTGRHLNGDELNAICGTKNLTKGEIIRTKFSPLFKFVDEKYQIIAVSSNDCGGSGQHDENEFFCESCIKCGKMIASEIKFSESSSSSNDENHSPRIDSASSDVSNNYPSNTALHMESVEIESAYDTVFQENAEVEAPVVLPVQSPDALVQAAPEESTPELTTNEPEVKATMEPEVKTPPEPEAKVIMEPEAKVIMEPEVKTPKEPETKATMELEVKTPTEPEAKATMEPEVKTTMEPEVKTLTEPEAKVTMEPEVKATMEPEVKATMELEVKVTNEPEIKTPTEPEVKATMELEVKVTMEPEAKVTMEPEVKVTMEPEVKATNEPEINTSTEPEVKATNEPEEDVILNEVTEKSNKTDLETEADKELAVEKREKAHELMHRRRKAKCCNLM